MVWEIHITEKYHNILKYKIYLTKWMEDITENHNQSKQRTSNHGVSRPKMGHLLDCLYMKRSEDVMEEGMRNHKHQKTLKTAAKY